MGQKQRVSNGFTLVEVMVAVVIFMITMLYGLSFFAFGARHVARAKDYTFAVQFAKNELESAMSSKDPFNDLPAGIRTGTKYSEEGIPFDSHLCAWTNNKNGEIYRVVTVRVSWQYNGVPLQVELNTIIGP